MNIKKHPVLIITVILIFSLHIVGYAYQPPLSTGGNTSKLSDVESRFYNKANKMLDETEYDDVVQLADQYIKKYPAAAIYHQFKGLALVLKYTDSILSKVGIGKDNITKAVKEFEIAKKLDPKNEDKALSAIVLAYVAAKDKEKAKEVFKPALKKYPRSVHLNYVGINYFKMMGKKSRSMFCKNFVVKHNPKYDGKPVFAGVALVISISTLAKILGSAIIVGYIRAQL